MSTCRLKVSSFLLISFLVLLSGCSLKSYEASIRGPGGQYYIVGRQGALIEVVQPDGTHIKADDRGHPDQPSALSNMASVAGAALINRKAD